MQVHTRAIFPFRLPKGLHAGAIVTVVSIEDGVCTVRNHFGKEWTVDAVCLDPGQLIWLNGRWVPDTEYERVA